MPSTHGSRTEQVAEACVALADSVGGGADVIERLHQFRDWCTRLLPVAAVSVVFADQRGDLRLVCSSSEAARMLGTLELHSGQGPCVEAFRTGESVAVEDFTGRDTRWPQFTEHARASGYRTTQALPLRMRGEVAGAAALLRFDAVRMAARDERIAQALADVTTMSILRGRAIRQGEELTDQLQTALNTRVVIEQAKGVLAERNAVDMPEAFGRLRRYARSRNVQLTDVARDVVARVASGRATIARHHPHA